VAELSKAQLGRQDAVHNACHALIEELAGQKVKWDIEQIGEVADVVQGIVCDKLGLMTEMEFMPYVEEG